MEAWLGWVLVEGGVFGAVLDGLKKVGFCF